MPTSASYKTGDPSSKCRHQQFDGIWYEDPSYINWTTTLLGYDELSVGCINNEKGEQLKKYVRENNSDWIFSRKSTDRPIMPHDCTLSWGGNVYKFLRKQLVTNIDKCCTHYTKGSQDQAKKCNEDYCIGSDKCKEAFGEGCTFLFSDAIITKINGIDPTATISTDTCLLYTSPSPRD